jgi:phage FluMu protein Com
MVSTVLCEKCNRQVSPVIAFWDGVKLKFKCPECGALNSRSGRFQELMQEVH